MDDALSRGPVVDDGVDSTKSAQDEITQSGAKDTNGNPVYPQYEDVCLKGAVGGGFGPITNDTELECAVPFSPLMFVACSASCLGVPLRWIFGVYVRWCLVTGTSTPLSQRKGPTPCLDTRSTTLPNQRLQLLTGSTSLFERKCAQTVQVQCSVECDSSLRLPTGNLWAW